jgi:hypothetical protein
MFLPMAWLLAGMGVLAGFRSNDRMSDDGMSDDGMSTAEYAIGTIAAAAFAAVLYAVVTGNSVVTGLGSLVQRALTAGF